MGFIINGTRSDVPLSLFYVRKGRPTLQLLECRCQLKPQRQSFLLARIGDTWRTRGVLIGDRHVRLTEARLPSNPHGLTLSARGQPQGSSMSTTAALRRRGLNGNSGWTWLMAFSFLDREGYGGQCTVSQMLNVFPKFIRFKFMGNDVCLHRNIGC